MVYIDILTSSMCFKTVWVCAFSFVAFIPMILPARLTAVDCILTVKTPCKPNA